MGAQDVLTRKTGVIYGDDVMNVNAHEARNPAAIC